MKRFISILALLCAISIHALAQEVSEYTVLPGAVNMEGMLALTFGEQANKAQLDDRDYAFYDLPGSDGPPFCGANDVDYPGQMDITIYTENYGGSFQPYLLENIEPSGIAQCRLPREEAIAQAEEIMAALGLDGYQLYYVSAHGKVEAYDKHYGVFFGQTLHDRPVYWSAQSAETSFGFMDSNGVTMYLGDEGVITVEGNWSRFEPYGTAQEAMAPERAMETLSTDAVELCYLLMPGQEGNVAIPAYRWQNQFIHAVTGATLQ